MPTYEIQGVGIDSGRKRKRIYIAINKDKARQIATVNGTKVKTIIEIPPEPPTEGQLEYAKGIKLHIPEGVTSAELSDLLTNKEEGDEPAVERDRVFAERYELEVTQYIGKKSLFDYIQSSVAHPGKERDMLGWFVFCVYRDLVKDRLDAAISSPDDAQIQRVVDILIADDGVIRSVRRYQGRDLIWFGEWTKPNGKIISGGSNRTMAYKKSTALLQENLNIQKKVRSVNVQKKANQTTYPHQLNQTTHKQETNQKAKGCLVILIVITVITVAFFSVSLMDLF